MLRAVVVGPTYPHRGGIAHYTALLASHLNKRHATRVYSFQRLYPQWLFPGRGQFDPGSPLLVHIEANRWLIPWWPPSWWRVQRDWSTWQPTVVVIQWWVPFMAPMTAWLATQARRKGVQVAMLCHNVLPHERSWLDGALVRLALSRADRLIVHGEPDRDRARRLLPNCQVDVVPLPSYAGLRSAAWSRERARSALDLNGQVVLFFGFVRPYKGLIDLLDALPAVLSETDVTLLVVGEIWGKAEEYHARVRALNLEARVKFVDRYVPNDEMEMFFAAADLAVLPYREATGSAVLQLAFGLGVPVVATRTGGMAEAVDDGQTGFLVDPGDVNGLSRAIARFFRENCGPAMRDRIARRSLDAGWDRLIAAIEKGA
jgi:glycosyltransferase involved in cell wall biosynthesis